MRTANLLLVLASSAAAAHVRALSSSSVSTAKVTFGAFGPKAKTTSTTAKSSSTVLSTTKATFGAFGPKTTSKVVSSSISKASSGSSSSAAASASASISAVKPLPLVSSFLQDLDNGVLAAPIFTSDSGVTVNASVYTSDMVRMTAAEIKSYNNAGKVVACYFSAGAYDPARADYLNFDPVCVCGPGGAYDASHACVNGTAISKQGAWNAWDLDIHSEYCKTNVKAAVTKRIMMAKEKGCNAIDADNIDTYLAGAPHGNTQADEFDYLMWLTKAVHDQGMLIGMKNGGAMLSTQYSASILAAFDFNIIESCHVYNECGIYDPFLAAGKPQLQMEYSNLITTCPTDLKEGQNLAVFSGLTVNSKAITLYCPGPKA